MSRQIDPVRWKIRGYETIEMSGNNWRTVSKLLEKNKKLMNPKLKTDPIKLSKYMVHNLQNVEWTEH